MKRMLAFAFTLILSFGLFTMPANAASAEAVQAADRLFALGLFSGVDALRRAWSHEWRIQRANERKLHACGCCAHILPRAGHAAQGAGQDAAGGYYGGGAFAAGGVR